jgi:DNA-binding response OmpR family regulator
MESATCLVGRSVLIVEDDPLIAIGLKVLLEEEGASVHVEATPANALHFVKQAAPSAAVLDFGPNGDDTEQLCRALRAYGIPFVYYTGLDDLGEKSLGAPIVTKPASAEALIATIKELFRLSRSRP